MKPDANRPRRNAAADAQPRAIGGSLIARDARNQRRLCNGDGNLNLSPVAAKLRSDMFAAARTFERDRGKAMTSAMSALRKGRRDLYDGLMECARKFGNSIDLLHRNGRTSPRLYDGDYRALLDLERWPNFAKRRTDLCGKRWQGEPLQGKTVLLYPGTVQCDGFGDQIQFIRYVAPLVSQGARVIAEIRPELMELFAPLGIAEMIPYGGEVPAHDYHSPYIFLPAMFGSTLENIPPSPYLQAPAGHLAKWRNRLPENDRLRVGLVWSGKPDAYTEVMGARWIGFDQLEPILDVLSIEDLRPLSIRKGMTDQELKVIADDGRILHIGDDFEDFSDTAAVVSLCDLVITIDGSVAHLAGAMGVPTWLMLMDRPHWFFGLTGEKTPWYSSARLFRQRRADHWESVIDEVAHALAGALKSSMPNQPFETTRQQPDKSQ